MRRMLRYFGGRGLGPVALLAALVVASTGLGAGLAADAALERSLTVRHEDRAWQTTPEQLGAQVSLGHLVGSTDWLRNLEASELAASLPTRDEGGPALPARASDEDLAAWVEEIASEVEEPARDARIEDTQVTSAEQLAVRDARPGLEVDREAAVDALRETLRNGGQNVRLPVVEVAPERATEDVEAAVDELRDAVADALATPVSVSHEDRTWQVTAGELGATVHLDEEDAMQPAGGEDGLAGIRLDLEPGEVEAVIEQIAAEAERQPRDARLDGSSGSLRIVPERDGIQVERDEAAERLRQALEGGGTEVELPTERTTPAVTADDYDRVLYLRQDARRLELYVDGTLARSWPVAVGQAGHETPTGRFVVGDKRHRPTWVNPSPNGWGSDMPRRVEPGPDNPLGVRALNWNQGGRDTLIRFHGTPDEDSIGQAASRGCVRLSNEDVRELYDLVPSGTPIVSVR